MAKVRVYLLDSDSVAIADGKSEHQATSRSGRWYRTAMAAYHTATGRNVSCLEVLERLPEGRKRVRFSYRDPFTGERTEYPEVGVEVLP